MKFLETDYYKLTMAQAIAQHYPRAEAEYELIVRTPVTWREDVGQYSALGELSDPSDAEIEYLRTLPDLTPVFVELLRGYHWNLGEVQEWGIGGDGQLRVRIRGPWFRTVLWEVPLMALISERQHGGCTAITWEVGMTRLSTKIALLKQAGIQVAEGGTRRRYARLLHDNIVRAMAREGVLSGTSNVQLSREVGLAPVGTVAHEWFMFHGACFGYEEGNARALDAWAATYGGRLGIALADTWTTAAFLRSFDGRRARLYDGVRQDSGDPLAVAERVIAHYEALGIDPRTKAIVFSDGLTVPRAIAIRDALAGRIGARFLIGTDLTCDVPGVTPLNMVLKLTRCRLDADQPWRDTVKLSDAPGKALGPTREVERCRAALGIA